jgi:MATE family multidrug resistance protein
MTIAVSNGAARGAWAAEARATLALAWPLILTNLAQIAITTTDVLMMGRLGPEALAAGNLGVAVYFALFIFAIGIAMATSPMMAQAIGRRRHAMREVRRTVRQGMWATLAMVVPAWVVLWQADAILRLLGQAPELAAAGGDYVRALQWGLLPALWFIVLRCFISALERPKAGLVVTVLTIALNAFCNWVLMFGKLGFPALGLVGAGISSTLANSFMFASLLGYVLWDRRFRRYHLLGRLWRTDWPRLRELWRIGLPIGVALGLETMVFNATAFLMGLIGTESLAAHAIALQIASATFMVPLGVAQAATVRVGLSAGRGDPPGVARAGWTALVLGIGFMAIAATTMIATPRPLVALFLDLDAPGVLPVVELAAGFLVVAGLFQLVDGAQVVGAGVLRGLKDTRVPMLFAALGYWIIGLPVGATLAFAAGLDGVGLWLGLAVGLAAVAVLMLARWQRRMRLGLVPAAQER